jgi:hypothetical protein
MKLGAAQPDVMYGPHASVTSSALGLLPSIALSSEQVQLTYHTDCGLASNLITNFFITNQGDKNKLNFNDFLS